MQRHISLAISILTLVAAAPASLAAVSPFVGADSMTVAAGEVHEGDLYFGGRAVDVTGRLEGDLFGWAQSIIIDGEVGGDVLAAGQSISIAGRVEDSVRAFVQNGSIRGTVDGDLLICGATVDITETAHITGNVYVFSGLANIAGKIDGNLKVTAGETVIKAIVGRDAEIEADAITFGDQASIGGDLVYTSRTAIKADLDSIVAGSVTSEEPKIDEGDEDEGEWAGFTIWTLVKWIAQSLMALIVGWVAIALGRGAVERAVSPVGTDTMMGGMIGFGAFLVVPAAAALAIALVLSAPLGLIALVLFVVALYVGKMPVAIWVGRYLLARAGVHGASPFAAMAVGIPMLYFLFLIPYWIGTLLWLAATWIGLGSIVLSIHGFMQQRSAKPATAE